MVSVSALSSGEAFKLVFLFVRSAEARSIPFSSVDYF
jgi:hypothetical protein